jgi:hypothetical protein
MRAVEEHQIKLELEYMLDKMLQAIDFKKNRNVDGNSYGNIKS